MKFIKFSWGGHALKSLVLATAVLSLMPVGSLLYGTIEGGCRFSDMVAAIAASRGNKNEVRQEETFAKTSLEHGLRSSSSQRLSMPSAEMTLQLGAGDVVELNIFEKLVLPSQDKAATESSTKASYIRRTDLSGEYAISNEGDIGIPTLGRFKVKQLSPQRLEQDLAHAYQASNGRAADITVRLVSRPPIYVGGSVNQPGVYKYVHGMTVAHAVALASGLVRPSQTAADGENPARQLYEYKSARIRLEQALVEQSRLIAERDKLPAIAVLPVLLKLSGNDRAKLLIDRENELLTQDIQLRQRKRDASKQSIELYERESKAVRAQMGYMSDHLEYLTRLRSQLNEIKKSGYLSDRKLVDIETEILDLQRKRSDLIAVAADIDHKLFTMRNEVLTVELERNLAVRKRLTELEMEIAELQMSMQLARHTLDQTHKFGSTGFPSYLLGEVVYELMQSGQSADKFIPVEETARLMPGSVLRISRSADAGTLASLPATQHLPADKEIYSLQKK